MKSLLLLILLFTAGFHLNAQVVKEKNENVQQTPSKQEIIKWVLGKIDESKKYYLPDSCFYSYKIMDADLGIIKCMFDCEKYLEENTSWFVNLSALTYSSASKFEKTPYVKWYELSAKDYNLQLHLSWDSEVDLYVRMGKALSNLIEMNSQK